MNNTALTLGSLFSGAGSFELAATRLGIKPIWASEVEPFPIAVTKKHFPDMIHLGDICKVNGSKIPPVDIITGGFCCFPAGTLVLTDMGYKPIETIKIGDTVLTHKNHWHKVTAVGSRESETIMLKGNCNLETTAEHPIYSADIKKHYPHKENGKRGNQKTLVNIGKWTNAKNMNGKQWATPREVPALAIPMPLTKQNEKPLPEFNAEFFYFLGRWLGDGWVNNYQRSGRSLGQTMGHICLCDSTDKEDEIIAAVSAVSKNYSVAKNRGVSRVTFSSVVFASWLTEQFGKGATNKTIPAWVFGLPEHFRIELMRGIAESDGYTKGNKICISSVSKQLVYGIRLLAESLGYSTSVSIFKRPKQTVIEGRIVNQKDTYTVAIVDSPKNTNMPHGVHTWYKCRNVIPTKETKIVYNMTVDVDNSYIADGVVVHNCQDLSVAGKQIGLHGARSGLFFQMIRIIREMLTATDGNFPRYLIFENVVGLLSSSKGADFREVMDEISALGFITDPNILDSQDFKIAQRRKRVFIACINKKYYNPDQFFGIPNCREKRMQKALANWASVASEAETFSGITSRPHAPEKQRLSEILEKDVDQRYYLTVAACLGILRRVDAKGKEIPGLLRSALESQADPCRAGRLFTSKKINGCQAFEPGICGRLGRKGTENLSPTLRADMGDNRTAVAFQSGGVIRNNSDSVWEEVSPTLRAETHGGDNQPSVAIPIDQRNATRNAEKGDNCGVGIGVDGESAYTVTAEYTGAIAVENRPNDSRIKIKADNICQTLDARMGMGGGNVPLVLNQREHAMTVSEDLANTQTSSQFKGTQAVCCVQGSMVGRQLQHGPCGKGVNEEISFSLTASDKHTVAYIETAPTLDTGLAHQNSNQIMMNGGAVVEEVRIPDSETKKITDEVYSMTTGSFPNINKEQAPSLGARDFKFAPILNCKNDTEKHLQNPEPDTENPAFGLDRGAYNQGANALFKPQIEEESIHSLTARGPGAVSAFPSYVVRRLTPTECLVLMGLPRDYCEGLENENPTAEDLCFWAEVFETYRRINNPTGKPPQRLSAKTEKQIRKFLKKPYSDSACYKMCGNSLVCDVAEFIFEGIVQHYQKTHL